MTTLDFAEAIRLYDSPRTLFVADPPWEGCEGAFEHTLGDRHGELAEQLLGIEGEDTAPQETFDESLMLRAAEAIN